MLALTTSLSVRRYDVSDFAAGPTSVFRQLGQSSSGAFDANVEVCIARFNDDHEVVLLRSCRNIRENEQLKIFVDSSYRYPDPSRIDAGIDASQYPSVYRAASPAGQYRYDEEQ